MGYLVVLTLILFGLFSAYGWAAAALGALLAISTALATTIALDKEK